MIAADTNVLVRLLVADEPRQHRAAVRLFEREDVFIPDSVLLETEWVLRDAYDYPPAILCNALRRLCGLPNVSLRDPALVAQVIDWHAAGMDFADAMHLATSGDMPFRSFDKALSRLASRVASRAVTGP